MIEKNEYQMKAAELLKKVLFADVTECETMPFEWGITKERTVTFRMCCINGIKWIAANDVCPSFTDKKKTFIARGVFNEADFCYLRCNRSQATLFVRADTLCMVKQEVTKMCSGPYDPQKPIIPVANAAIKANIPNTIVEPDVWMESVEAYHKRIELLAQSKKVNREMREREELEYEREKERKRIETGRLEERTLRDLVSQIESMGWNVTLSLKER